MLVRRATPHDVEGFIAVMTAVAGEGRWIATEPPVDGEALTARWQAMFDDGDAVFVLEDGGNVVGSLGLHATPAAGVASLGMSIVAQARGQGGGKALLRAAIEHAQGTELHKIELEVWPDNERAIALYHAFGFEVEGLRRDHYRRRDGSLRSAQVMALLLPS